MDFPFVEVNIEATRAKLITPIKIKIEPQCLESKTEIDPLCHIKLEQNQKHFLQEGFEIAKGQCATRQRRDQLYNQDFSSKKFDPASFCGSSNRQKMTRRC